MNGILIRILIAHILIIYITIIFQVHIFNIYLNTIFAFSNNYLISLLFFNEYYIIKNKINNKIKVFLPINLNKGYLFSLGISIFNY